MLEKFFLGVKKARARIWHPSVKTVSNV